MYAKWTAETYYAISYVLNGGTNNAANPAAYTATTGTIALADPVRTGYAFAGWYTDAKFKNRITSIPGGSTGNKTVYAKWTLLTYKISYQLNGGKNNAKNPLINS